MASEPATATELEEEQRQVEEAQRGNLDAMRPILERYAQPLYGTVILPRLGDAATAEDVLRDTLATAVEKIGRFTWQGKSIYPWLRQIAINKVYDVHRQSKRSRKLADAMVHEVPQETDPEQQADAQLIADQERAAHRARIDEAMGQLAERYRTAIELRLVEPLESDGQDVAAQHAVRRDVHARERRRVVSIGGTRRGRDHAQRQDHPRRTTIS